MSVIWYKVLSDLWDNKVRTLLATLSVATGVFAVGATFGMVDQMLAGMDAAHQAVYPSHVMIFLQDDIDRDIATRLKKVDGVVDIEAANQIGVRYKLNAADEWDSAVLVMRDDYDDQTYDRFQLREGTWPAKNSYGVERLSSQYYGVDIGDSVLFEVDGREKALKMSGKVRHPFVPPPPFGGPAFFFADAQGMERFDVAEGEFSQLLVRVDPYSEEFAREVASEIKDRLSKEDVGVVSTLYQDPEKHWGRPIMEGINLVLQILAVVSLGASAVLILNTLMSLITEQINQIGMIKAIGGSTGTIIKIYLVGVLAYGLLALLISLPLGAFVAFVSTRWLLNLFNIDYATFQYSERAFVFQMIAALAVPMVAALWPVLGGASITVREAIASYGLGGGKFGASRLDRLVERLGQRFLSTPYATALGNMFRRKGRLLLTQLTLITAGTMFLGVMTLSSSISLTLDNEFLRRNHDMTIYLEENERTDRVVGLAETMPGVEKAELWFDHGASILKLGQRTNEAGIGVEIMGVPTQSDMFEPLIVAGRWLRPDDGQAVVILKDMADDHNMHLGDTIILDLGELGHDEWQVVGFYQSILSGGVGDTVPIYANLEAVYHATKKHNIGSDLYVRTETHHEDYAEAMAAELKALFNTRNMDTDFSDTVYEFRDNVDAQFSIVVNMLLVLAVIVALVGGIGLAGSLSISVVERTREIGVMRAVGARTSTIMAMFVMEGLLQGLFSWLIVVPLSFVIGRFMANALGQAMFNNNLDYQYNFDAVMVWLVVIVVVSILASIAPAYNATKISVRDSLAYG
ncbi:MAG: FtsX-like permease family protein [Anaerolineae bacterium]|nr:FtsX-like permease family protein [Anaerolineae bacterium]